MKALRAGWAVTAAALLSTAAQAQTDPIGALLDSAPPAAGTPAPQVPTEDPEEGPLEAAPVTAEVPPAAPWQAAPGAVAAPPRTVVVLPPRPRTARDEPVHIDEVDRTPEGPPTATDLNYEARLRASFASAQGLQGPFDGRWTLSGGAGDLYDLQLVDTGSAPLEGVWRDVRRPGAPEASGFLTDLQRVGAALTFRFQPAAGGPMASVSLSPAADGRWTGDLDVGGRRSPVTMRRD